MLLGNGQYVKSVNDMRYGIPTVSVGIAAYNEEKNIQSLLASLVTQEERNFILKAIRIISDKSDDRTVEYARAISDRRLIVEDSLERLGKPARINQFFQEDQSDILVILDADIVLASPHVLSCLVEPFLSAGNVRLVSGNALPLPPRNFVSRVAAKGVEIWDDVRRYATKGSEMFFCEGSIRAFRKDLYKQMRFPLASADDVYPYLFCMQKGYGFARAQKATVYYQLPTTARDYIRQTERFLRSRNIHGEHFDKRMIREHYAVAVADKALILGWHLLANPWITGWYLLFWSRAKWLAIRQGKSRDDGRWEIAQSTKTISSK
jgi:glycosyltransferase involved in cell wall biosynthesis